MKSRAAGRNWRVEALAWAGAIALVAAAIFFSRGGDQPAEATPPQADPPAPPASTVNP